jgi:hypothetical protein
VIFTIGSATHAASLNASGVATYTGTAPTASGQLSLSAAYQGSSEFSTSTSNTLTESIATIPTTTALTISPSGGSLNAGTSYTLTATVTPSTGTTAPTGNVIFTIGSTTKTVALNASGVATYTGTAPIASGQLSLSAAYQGSSEFSTSTSNTLTESIVTNLAPVITSMSPAYATAGGATFTLTVNGSGYVNGSTLYWGNSALTTQLVSPSQLTAQVTAAMIAEAGTPTAITVQTPAPGGGTSNILQFEVDSAGSGSSTAPSFSNPAATVSAGNAASYPVSLPSSVSSASVNCLNLPTGASCSYTASSGTVSITTSGSTPKGAYQITVIFNETLPGSALAALVLAPFLLFPPLFLRRKFMAKGTWLTACIALLLLAGGAALATGCGGGGSGATVQPVQPTHQVSSSGVVSLTVQ